MANDHHGDRAADELADLVAYEAEQALLGAIIATARKVLRPATLDRGARSIQITRFRRVSFGCHRSH